MQNGEEEDGCEDAGECSPSHTRSTLRVLLFQHISQGWKKSCGDGGWAARGPAGVEEKNRLNVLTAALFFLHLFCSRI